MDMVETIYFFYCCLLVTVTIMTKVVCATNFRMLCDELLLTAAHETCHDYMMAG